MSNFVGDYSKPAPLLTRTRRLDGSVEREQVRLLRQSANDHHDGLDVVTAPRKSLDQRQ